MPLPVVISARQWQHTESKKVWILGEDVSLRALGTRDAFSLFRILHILSRLHSSRHRVELRLSDASVLYALPSTLELIDQTFTPMKPVSDRG